MIAALDSGHLRVAQKVGSKWIVNKWLKKAVLLSFRIKDNVLLEMASIIISIKSQLSLLAL